MPHFMHQWQKKLQLNYALVYVTMLYKCMGAMDIWDSMEFKNTFEILEYIKFYKELTK